jgi:hypothetical protein
MIVSAPLQHHNGFILRQCPFCTKYFKVKVGTGANEPQLYCPYCGKQWSNWHTAEQVKYFQQAASNYPDPPPDPPDDAAQLKKLKKPHIFLDCGHGDVIHHDGSQNHFHCIICGDAQEQHASAYGSGNKSKKKPKP